MKELACPDWLFFQSLNLILILRLLFAELVVAETKDTCILKILVLNESDRSLYLCVLMAEIHHPLKLSK